MRFITVTTDTGKTIYVNADNIEALEEASQVHHPENANAILVIGNANGYLVRETMDEVLHKILGGDP